MLRLLSCAVACAALGSSMSASASETPPRLELGAAFQPLSDEALGALRGAGFLSDLLATLPPNNTVSVQIGNNPPQTVNGTGPQSIVVPGASASAQTGTGTATPPSFSSSTTTTTTRTFTRTFSFSH